jgi:hypothetical protein
MVLDFSEQRKNGVGFFFFLQTHVLKKSKFECFIYSFALDVVLETSFEKLEYA